MPDPTSPLAMINVPTKWSNWLWGWTNFIPSGQCVSEYITYITDTEYEPEDGYYNLNPVGGGSFSNSMVYNNEASDGELRNYYAMYYF